jgi:hypothetical protein
MHFRSADLQIETILISDQVHCQTKVSVSTRTTNPVQVCLGGLGEVKINDHINSLDVNSSGKQICTHKVSASTIAKIMKHSVSVVLQHLSMNVEARITKFSYFLSQ